MAYNRGDLIELFFKLPDGEQGKPHPAIIISNEEVYLQDQGHICVMITSSSVIDTFSFKLEDSMFNKPLSKTSQARCHLVTFVMEEDIIKNGHSNYTMKSKSVDKMVVHINNISLTEQ